MWLKSCNGENLTETVLVTIESKCLKFTIKLFFSFYFIHGLLHNFLVPKDNSYSYANSVNLIDRLNHI